MTLPPPILLCSPQSSGGGWAPGTRSGATQEEVRQTAEGKVFNAVSQEVKWVTCVKTSCWRMGAAVSQGKDWTRTCEFIVKQDNQSPVWTGDCAVKTAVCMCDRRHVGLKTPSEQSQPQLPYICLGSDRRPGLCSEFITPLFGSDSCTPWSEMTATSVKNTAALHFFNLLFLTPLA